MKLDQITNKAKQTKEINPNDEYYTPKYAIKPILKYLKPNSTIWCPFDTQHSLYVIMLKENGHSVVHTHLNDGIDFFDTPTPKDIDYIISNPPYSLKNEVLKKLFSIKVPFAMLLGVVGIFESKKRFQLFKENKFEIMYFNRRVSYFKYYSNRKPELNPPFSSVYITSGFLPDRIVFEEIDKKDY
tara:strand:- start:69 stop:623 length:555 start_codon:yes stop_codon:yes gene_type:complete